MNRSGGNELLDRFFVLGLGGGGVVGWEGGVVRDWWAVEGRVRVWYNVEVQFLFQDCIFLYVL